MVLGVGEQDPGPFQDLVPEANPSVQRPAVKDELALDSRVISQSLHISVSSRFALNTNATRGPTPCGMTRIAVAKNRRHEAMVSATARPWRRRSLAIKAPHCLVCLVHIGVLRSVVDRREHARRVLGDMVGLQAQLGVERAATSNQEPRRLPPPPAQQEIA